MKKYIIIAITTFSICIQPIYSQITTNEIPISVQKGLGTLTKGKTKGTCILPIPNIDKILHEDSLCKESLPNDFQKTAVSIPVEIDINEDGVWSTLEDGGRLWQLEVYAEKALALDFVFSKFWLPRKGRFFFSIHQQKKQLVP